MRRLSLLLLGLSLAVTLWAQDIRSARFEFFQIADTPVGISTATLDPPNDGQMKSCEGRLETAQVRYRFDGGTVTATTGILLEIGDVIPITGHTTAAALRFVKTGSTTGALQVTCWY